ncbi:MAG: ribosome maturation factor RimM [Parvibaculum sp.]|uniref:ribosome maturation factor RimM n=1 Tax=Parvibaculum sp. TaxID=2024848 RepID=UPI0025EFC297|nr:ribosome maturation factor RimM [Parvibaculum sp.]MCE9648373.1 ribosome maturation factor RimM [Parvibaculum sp.]
MSQAKPDTPRVCLGVVIGAHGVRGLVRVKAFTEDPQAVAAYGRVETKDGTRRYKIETAGMAKDAVICKLEGVGDRDKAEAMRGTELYVDRAHLPEVDEDEGFYHADLIGLQAVGVDGKAYGKIVGVENFGAGDLLEIERPEGGLTVLVPFTAENVPSVEIEAGRLVLDPPDGLFEDKADE